MRVRQTRRHGDAAMTAWVLFVILIRDVDVAASPVAMYSIPMQTEELCKEGMTKLAQKSRLYFENKYSRLQMSCVQTMEMFP